MQPLSSDSLVLFTATTYRFCKVGNERDTESAKRRSESDAIKPRCFSTCFWQNILTLAKKELWWFFIFGFFVL